MRKLTKLPFNTLIILLLSMSSLSVSATSGRRSVPVRSTSAQPTPAKMTVRMNLATQSLDITVDADKADAFARIVVTNIIGRTVRTERVELSAGNNQLRVDLGDLPQGTYIVQMVSNSFTSEARKFIKANP